MNRRHKIAILGWRERILLFQSALMLPVTALGIKALGVQRWQAVMASLLKKQRRSIQRTPGPLPASGEVEIKRAREVARLVRAAANHGFYRANCLEQSLVLWTMLKRNGFESKIRFGARKEEDQLQAHAWVECFGMTLNEDRGVEERYSPFAGVIPTTTLKSQ